MIPSGLDRALDLGLRVFPCWADQKAPLTKHGVKDASADRGVVQAWAKQHPNANWGAAMGGGVFAVDVDNKHGMNGDDGLYDLIERHGEWPPHLTSRTPNRGTHHIFRGDGIRNSASKLARGIDVRGEGGYIVIPPSRLAAGAYEWLAPDAPIPAAPAWLVEMLRPRADSLVGPKQRAIPAGTRNDTLYRFACGLRAKNLGDDEAWDALLARNLDCRPPLDERELRQIFENAWRHAAGFPTTDLGNAERLVAAHGHQLRHLPELGWVRWDGSRWTEDQERRVMVMAADVARGIYAEASGCSDDARRKILSTHAVRTESRRALEAMTKLAESRPEVVERLKNFDADPMVLGVRNGIVDLSTGEFRPAVPADRIMQLAAVEFDPSAVAPLWGRFLREIFNEDKELIAFVQRAVGYSLTGLTTEQVMFIAHGTGANGKSVFVNVLRRIIGDYARAIQPETLMSRERGGSIPNDVARLRGARFVPTVEVEDGRKLAESLVKQMTGGDAMTARFLRHEFFEFVPKFKIWIVTNHRPVITGTDYAIWRRILLVPFEVTIPAERRDKELELKLMREAAGILNWALEGVRDWRQRGLDTPQKVLAATQCYRRDMDRVGLFLSERTRAAVGRTKKSVMYAAYSDWCGESGVYPVRSMLFHQKATDEHGLTIVVRDGYPCYDGVLLLPEDM